jgi:hypothetical protein
MVKWVVLVALLLRSAMAPAQVGDFKWLLGTWVTEEGTAFESWVERGKALYGEGYEKATTGRKNVTEQIRILKKNEQFFYVPDVAGRQGPVWFRITSFDAQGFVAENPEHDFPQRIVYKRMDNDHFQALISGGTKTLKYFFSRVN